MSLLTKIKSIRRIKPDSDLHKVQINIFTFVIMIGYVRSFQLANLYLEEKKILILVFTIIAFVISTALILILFFKPKHLQLVIHISLIVTLLDLINKNILLHEFYITHFQLIFMMIVWSIYGLNRYFGTIYSIAYSSLIFIYLYNFGTDFDIFPARDNPNFYIIWITYFFYNMIFIWSHYYYNSHLNIILLKKRKINKELTISHNNTTEFSNKVTNKLNSLLDSIIGISNRLLKKSSDDSNKRNLELLKFSSENLLEIINNIQYYSKINENNKQDKPFDLAKLLDNIYESFKVKTNIIGIELTFFYPERLQQILIVSDKNKLLQILYNILGNAIKFTPRGGKISTRIIELYCPIENTIILKFSIKDTGIGINPGKIDDIFKPFKQADNSITRKYGGTGLGLTIVQKALKSFNSEITVETEQNMGAKFSFEVAFRTINKKQNNKEA